MATITFSSTIGGVAADVTSAVLSDPTGSYGVRRTDTGAVVVAAGTALVNDAEGTYTYEFTSVGGVEYQYYVEWVYNGETHHVDAGYNAVAA